MLCLGRIASINCGKLFMCTHMLEQCFSGCIDKCRIFPVKLREGRLAE
jgi:hypothetical protein